MRFENRTSISGLKLALTIAAMAGATNLVACQGSLTLGASSFGAGSTAAPAQAPAAPAPAPQVSAAPSLAGTWIGTGYTCTDGSAPREEQVEITVSDNVATAVKVTGDHCVAASEITWRGALGGDSFPVQVQVGAPGVARRYVSGQVTRRGANAFELSGPGWVVSYRKAEASAAASTVPVDSPSTSASLAGSPSSKCDIRKVDWQNFAYPRYVLKNGSAPAGPSMHIRIEDDPVVYADLRGDGTTIAFVSINTGADSDTIEDIYAYDEDARCKPRLLLKTGGMPEEGGKIVGKSYVFVRFNLQKNQEERVEVRAVGTRIVEAKVTPVSPS